jgi:hypothetical protein
MEDSLLGEIMTALGISTDRVTEFHLTWRIGSQPTATVVRALTIPDADKIKKSIEHYDMTARRAKEDLPTAPRSKTGEARRRP